MSEPDDSHAADDERGETDRQGEESGPEADSESDDGTGHLDDIEDGVGCTEIWERLSERRETARNES